MDELKRDWARWECAILAHRTDRIAHVHKIREEKSHA
jgi:hypothetical protein